MKQPTSFSLASLLLVLFAPSSVFAATTFYLTKIYYHPGADHEAICKMDYGPSAIVADFGVDLATLSETELQQTFSALGIEATKNEYYYFVTFNLDHGPAGAPDEAYFFEYNAGPAPAFFGKLDNYHGINVGLTDKYGRILCKVEASTNRRLRDVNTEEEQQENSEGDKAEAKSEEEDTIAGKLRRKLSWGW